MRIGIDAHMLGDRSGGNESFYEGILKEMPTDDGNEYILFMKEGVDDSPYRDRLKIVRFESESAFKRNFIELPKLCKKYELSLLHTQYYIPFSRPCPVVVTIHDICFEHFKNIFKKGEYIRNKLLIPYAAKHSAAVVTVSEFSKKDIVNTYKTDPNKVYVVNNAVDKSFRVLTGEEIKKADVRGKFGIGTSPYIICVGNLQPRKNIPRLVEAFLLFKEKYHSDYKLVIVGKKAWLFDESLKAAKENEESIILTDYVEREDLIALLNGAEGFAYPSIFEGFGIPPLEALACGTKVAVSDIEVMHEVLGEKAVFFDPYIVESIAEGLKTMLDGEIYGGEKYGGESRFSWKKSAKDMRDVYYQALK